MEILTGGRDEALGRLLDGLSGLIAAAGEIKKHEESFHRYTEYMIHARELLRKLQSQQATIESARLLPRMETEVKKARDIIDGYKSKSRRFRPLICKSVVSKLNQSSKEIYAVLDLLQFAQINAALNIKESADAIIHGIESIQRKLSTDSNAILSSLDLFISVNSGNQQQASHRSKGPASSCVCPLPVQIEDRESEACQQQPPSWFFSCPLTGEVLEDPVSVSCDHSFERKAIEKHFDAGQNFCPLCSKELSSTGKLELTSNSTLRNSILEWKKRKEQINAERNAKKKFIDAAAKITPDNMESTNQALGDLLALMKEIPSCISAATESNCKLVPKLAELLKNNSSENSSLPAVLECLLRIAGFSDENKEIIGKRGVIQCLLKLSMAEPNAVAVLLEISRNKAIAEKIGGIPYSILILISFLDEASSDAAEMARKILENLSTDISSIVAMAKFGYFTPFLDHFNSQEISQETRAHMAEELAQIQLTETSAKNLLNNERFIGHLTELLRRDHPAGGTASLNCIKQLITFDEPKASFLNNERAIPALLRLITAKSIDGELKQKSLEILISLIQTTQPTDHGFRALFSSSSIRDLLNQIEISASEDQISLLRLLLAMARSSSAAGERIASDHNAMSRLFSAINAEQNSEVKTNALNLIHCISAGHQRLIRLPSSPSKESIVGSLITILDEGGQSATAAAGILIHLSPDDETLNEMLQSSAVLKSIRALIAHPSSLENALGVLLRGVNLNRSPCSSEFRRKVSKLLRADLVQILSSGGPLSKQRAAAILSRLSRRTVDSSVAGGSSVRRRFAYIRRPAKEGDGCPVHKCGCSPQDFACLVMDEAVRPLIEMVRAVEVGSAEAALIALDTLFDAGCDGDGTAAAIVEAGGATPVLEALERGEPAVKEKALELFRKICEHRGITAGESDRFRGLVLNMVRTESGPLKVKVVNLLKDLSL